MPTVAITVTRTLVSGSPAALSLVNANNHEIRVDSLNLGQPGNIIEWAESRFSDGGSPIAKRKGNAQGGMIVDCIGSTHTNCQSRIDELTDAFDQLYFDLSLVVDSTTYTWRLYAASAIGVGLMSPEHEYGYIAAVTLAFPRSPTPVAGPW